MAKPVRILSLDGGGIRGIIPGQVLCEIEKMIQQATGKPGARVADYFDLVAGTSTGGILTCALLCPDEDNPAQSRFSASEVVDMYLERGDEIFEIPLWHRISSGSGTLDEKYPADGLEEVLEDYFGELWLSDLVKPCLIPAYDIRRRRAHFFTQHGAERNLAQDFRVRDVARATAAAPTYFETVRIKSRTKVPYPLIDGGVFANNPALCAYAEVRAGYARAHGISPPARADSMAILSIGTGKVEKSYTYREAKDWGSLQWLRPLIDILLAGTAETVDYQLRQIYDAVKAPNQYLRVEPAINPSVVSPDLDNASPENLVALRELGQETAERDSALLKEFVDMLIALGPEQK
ncbi:MAG: patatin-like phospholipase family protein [Proteobacteria bacterium]|nr:patatin-like phospholipase family protein [Pseudomonadota bacterium]